VIHCNNAKLFAYFVASALKFTPLWADI